MDPIIPCKYWEWDVAVRFFGSDLGQDYPCASSQGRGKSIQTAPKDGKNQEEIIGGREKLNQHWNFSMETFLMEKSHQELLLLHSQWRLEFYFLYFSDFLHLFPF